MVIYSLLFFFFHLSFLPVQTPLHFALTHFHGFSYWSCTSSKQRMQCQLSWQAAPAADSCPSWAKVTWVCTSFITEASPSALVSPPVLSRLVKSACWALVECLPSLSSLAGCNMCCQMHTAWAAEQKWCMRLKLHRLTGSHCRTLPCACLNTGSAPCAVLIQCNLFWSLVQSSLLQTCHVPCSKSAYYLMLCMLGMWVFEGRGRGEERMSLLFFSSFFFRL